MMPLTMAKTGQNVENADASMLAAIGGAICWIFAPLGFGNWQAAVTTLTGLIAKEEVVGTMGVLYGGNLTATVGTLFTGLTAYSFMIFNLLCAPCFAAMGAIKREMGGFNKWFWAAIGWECAWAYALSLVIFQLGALLVTGTFSFWTLVAVALLVLLVWGLFRRPSAPAGPGAPAPAAPAGKEAA